MSRVADGLRKAAEAKRGESVVGLDPTSAGQKLLPLRRDTLEPPWRLEDVDPQAVGGAQSEERVRPAPPRSFTTRPTVVPPPRGPAHGFAAKSALRTFSNSMRQQIEGLVERVFLPASGHPARCVAFAGVGTEASSVSVTAAVAETLAIQTTATVCVIDANFATPTLHDCFGIANEAGLVDALTSDCALSDVVQAVGSNLYVLPAGRGGVRPSFARDYARAQLAQLSKAFEYVLVHAEPIGSSGEAAGAAPLMDGVVLVVAAEQTRRDLGRSVVDHLRGSGITIIGAVLVNRRFPIPNFLYRWL